MLTLRQLGLFFPQYLLSQSGRMNLFSIAGGILHLMAILFLLAKMWQARSCAGISGKSQVLYAMVFTARYLDLFTSFISYYNSVMKVAFILCTYASLVLIFWKFRSTYDSKGDSFRAEVLVVAAAVLALCINYGFTVIEVLWAFSVFLESVAILPQSFMIYKTGKAETVTPHYVFALGAYRTLYFINWVWRYYTEGFYDLTRGVGCVQTLLYCVFLYLYITKVVKGKNSNSLADEGSEDSQGQGTVTA